jgi:hypothetical protein
MRQRIEIDVWTPYSPCFPYFTASPIKASTSPRVLYFHYSELTKGILRLIFLQLSETKVGNIFSLAPPCLSVRAKEITIRLNKFYTDYQ